MMLYRHYRKEGGGTNRTSCVRSNDIKPSREGNATSTHKLVDSTITLTIHGQKRWLVRSSLPPSTGSVRSWVRVFDRHKVAASRCCFDAQTNRNPGEEKDSPPLLPPGRLRLRANIITKPAQYRGATKEYDPKKSFFLGHIL